MMRIAIFISFWFLPALLFSQESSEPLEEDLFANALLQVETALLIAPTSDSLLLGLKGDAVELAEAGNWSDALELVGLLLEMLDVNQSDIQLNEPSDQTVISLAATNSRIGRSFSIETGFDFSRQEFGISPVETDTSILEELQNPFVEISYSQPVYLENSELKFRHDLRADNQFLNYGLNMNWVKKGKVHSRIETSIDYNYAQNEEFASYLDSRTGINLSGRGRNNFRWSLDGELTYKDFSNQDSIAADVFSGTSSLYLERVWKSDHSLLFRISPGFYRLGNSQGRFSQNQSMLSYRYQAGLNNKLELSISSLLQDYEYALEPVLTNDAIEEYENSYITFEPEVLVEQQLASHFGIKLTGRMERLWFRDSNSITPDELMFTAKVIPKLYFNELNSIGLGWRGTSKEHRAAVDEETIFAQEADYFANGLVATFDYLSLGGMFINLEYEAYWRSYPNTTENTFSTFYSDRFTHLISLIAWLPLNDNWRIQAFANFEDEEDREFKVNDSQSTILSISLQYSF